LNVGYENCIKANSGKQGLEKVKKENPYLVIMVTELPDLDAFEICRRIKKVNGESPKVILMTGLAEMVNVGKARDVGADDYVVMTSDYMFLLNSVKKVLSSKKD
jgi:DNA-binding response OmpR family regulator